MLKNRFGLRDGKKLKELEDDLSAIRQNDLLAAMEASAFDTVELKSVLRECLRLK